MENKKMNEILKQDPITIAVDKCNDILEPLGLCVDQLAAKDVEAYERTKDLYAFRGGKLFTKEFIEKMEEKVK